MRMGSDSGREAITGKLIRARRLRMQTALQLLVFSGVIRHANVDSNRIAFGYLTAPARRTPAPEPKTGRNYKDTTFAKTSNKAALNAISQGGFAEQKLNFKRAVPHSLPRCEHGRRRIAALR